MKDDLHLHRSLKELEDYRSIGTVEEFKNLKELNTPKKTHNQKHPVYETIRHHCPNCEINLTGIGFDYCIECGQKIKWDV